MKNVTQLGGKGRGLVAVAALLAIVLNDKTIYWVDRMAGKSSINKSFYWKRRRQFQKWQNNLPYCTKDRQITFIGREDNNACHYGGALVLSLVQVASQ